MKSSLTCFLVLFFVFFLIVEQVEASKLVIDPPTGTYSVGQQFQSKIFLDTQGTNTAGVDVLLKYDPELIKITNVQNGNIYNKYVGQKIDNDIGSFGLSGIVALDDESGFSGSGTFAIVVFEGIKPGTASVDFDFSPGVSSDSNVAAMSSVDDSLSSTTGAKYNIVAQTGDRITDSTPSALPKSGVIEDTIMLLGTGIGVIVLGILLLL